MSSKKNNKTIFAGLFLLIVIVCFAGFKLLKPNNGNEITQASSAGSSIINYTSNVITSTKKITQIITESATSKPSTTAPVSKTTKKHTAFASKTTEKAVETYTRQSTEGVYDYSCFDNCAFLGNSRVLALKTYSLVKNVYGAVGLTVDTVFTKSAPGSSVPVIDELNGKHFDKIFVLFGDNECGWPNTEVFIERYVKVVNAVKERVPEAEIYIQSILPVSKHEDDTSKYGCSNQRINELNVKIKEMAIRENVKYINPAEALKDSYGRLPDDAASDGVHLNKKSCIIWLNYLVENA